MLDQNTVSIWIEIEVRGFHAPYDFEVDAMREMQEGASCIALQIPSLPTHTGRAACI